MGYQYPIDADWSVEEINTVIKLWTLIEDAYEDQVDIKTLLDQYQAFKQVVPMKMDEKRLGQAFEKTSGYSLYRTIQQAKQAKTKKLQMEK